MNVLDSYIDQGGGTGTRGFAPLLFGAASILVVICLRWPATLMPAGLVAIVVGLVWATSYTRHHTKWLVLPLLVNEALASVNLIDDSIRPTIRYSMLAIFCLPLLPNAWRTGLLKQGGFKLYALYFLWGAITISYSIYPFYSMGRVSSAAVLFATIVAIIASIETEEEIYELIRIFWIGSMILMGVLLFSAVALPTDQTWKLDDNGMLRFTGVFNSPNQVGELMLTTVASGLILWPAALKKTRTLIVVTTLTALIFDGMADSRSSFIAMSVGVLLLAIQKYRMRAVAIGGLVLIVGFVAFSHLEGGQEYVTRGDVSSLTGRTEIWRYIFHAIRERPLLGWGFEVEGQIFQNRDFPLWEQIWNEGPRSSLHNGYLSRAVGVGIPATLMWLFIITRAVGFAIFKQKSLVLRDAALVSSVPVLILNMVESTAGDCRYSVGLLMAIVWALSEKARLASLKNRSQIGTVVAPESPLKFIAPREDMLAGRPQLNAL
jgi:O-antigen ligase